LSSGIFGDRNQWGGDPKLTINSKASVVELVGFPMVLKTFMGARDKSPYWALFNFFVYFPNFVSRRVGVVVVG